jgi:CxxC-x17-CxxC domain-containing protein
MGDFKKKFGPKKRHNKFNGSKKSFAGGSKFGGSRGSDREMYDATCSECGRGCKVPFRPNGSKPVYCSNCFETHSDKDSGRNPRQSFNSRPPHKGFQGGSGQNNSRQLEEINDKLDLILKLMRR